MKLTHDELYDGHRILIVRMPHGWVIKRETPDGDQWWGGERWVWMWPIAKAFESNFSAHWDASQIARAAERLKDQEMESHVRWLNQYGHMLKEATP